MFLWRTDKNDSSIIIKYPPYLFHWVFEIFPSNVTLVLSYQGQFLFFKGWSVGVTNTYSRAVNFQIDLRGGQWKTIWFTSGGQFERFLSSVFVGCSKVTGKIILDPTHILKFGEWHAISFLCMHVHTKRYWKVLSRVVAINFAKNAQWRNRK